MIDSRPAMPKAPSASLRIGLAGVAAGLALGTTLLAPSAAQAQVASVELFYSFQQNPPVPPTGTLDGPTDVWWVKLVATELLNEGVKFDFISNFSDPENFANDFVFSLKTALSNIFVTCTPSSAASGTTCEPEPFFKYDPDGKQNFVGTKDWELALLSPPDPGGIENKLSGEGDEISFTVRATVLDEVTRIQRALQIQDFNTSGPSGEGGAFSCTHMQGIAPSGTNATSSRVCSGPNPTPFIEPLPSSVPGPLPLFGAAAAFGFSRKLRTRIQSSRQQATIS